MQFSKTTAGAVFGSVLMIVLSACDKEGPLEEAGEEVDDKVEDTGDAVEDATDGG